MSGLNRVLVRFRDEFASPAMRARAEELEALIERLREHGQPPRVDTGRAWEIAHVLGAVDDLRPRNVLDVGGANAPLAYLLAARGIDVTVLDVDADAVERTRRNAEALDLAGRLRAHEVSARGPWPVADASVECALSVSVFEGVLRRRRARHWADFRRVLQPGASLFVTFDFGPGARFVGDAPRDAQEVHEQLVLASGLELVGPALEEPEFDPEVGPPVKALVPTVDGHDQIVAAYSFGALHLRRPAR